MAQQIIISWMPNLCTTREGKRATHVVTNISTDFSSRVKVVIEKGNNVDVINMTMECARDIGFINLETLKKYCK